jgi:hypothetical protein
MSGQGFVYTGMLNAEQLQKLLKRLENAVWLSWDLANINFNQILRDNGTAFNTCCEIRWQRAGDNALRVQVLSDEPIEVAPLMRVDGEWRTEEMTTRAVPLDAFQLSPPFGCYPVTHSPRARLRCRVFFLDGMAVFVSAREVTSDET